jgi:predicted dehydrogenase
MINIGVIGYGYWGPNIVRNFTGLDGAQVHSVCDFDPNVQGKIRKAYPNTLVTSDPNDILNSPEIDVVAVITPVSSHYELTKKALENGKYVFVEKPFTTSVAEAEELIELAERKKRIIMVDHTFIFTGAVRRIKQLIEEETLGELYYYDSIRVNLGLFQHDVNVVWDLAPHDFAVMDFLIDEKPLAVAACGKAHVNKFEDMAYITVMFRNNMIAHFNVNWLSPVKMRTTLIGGEKKMLVWNDLEADEKIKIYDRGIEVKNRETEYRMRINYRTGDMYSPRVEQGEALRREAIYFLECVTDGKTPVNDGQAGLRVVKMLTACNESIRSRGREVML